MIMQVTQPSVASDGIPVPFDGVEPILLDQSKLSPLFDVSVHKSGNL